MSHLQGIKRRLLARAPRKRLKLMSAASRSPRSAGFLLLQYSYAKNAFSNLKTAHKWINRGLQFTDKLPLPNDLYRLCVAVTAVPGNMLPRLLPPDDISVVDLTRFRLPEIGKWPFSEKITFQEDLPRGKLFIRAEIPPEPYVEELRKNFGQALLDGKISMRDPRTTDARLPLWVIEFWWALHRAHNSRMEWTDAKAWLHKKQAAARDEQAFRYAERQLIILPWNKSLHGPAAGVGRTTKHLLRFLSDDEWLSDALVDMMTACLVSRLPNKRHDTIIVNTCFGDAIRSAKDISYHGLRKLEESAKTHRYLYAPMYTKEHYVAFEIDFQTRSFRYGDSLDSEHQELDLLVEKLQSWFSGRFGGEFCDRGPNLPHGHQKDRVSCALFAINTIEHNVFGHTLGVADPAYERARWFILTSESQIREPAVPVPVVVSNGQAGPYLHPTQPASGVLPLGEHAPKQQAEERTRSIQEKAALFREKQKQRQEKAQQEQAEKERTEQSLELERVAHEKAETARMEYERLEHERIAREKAEADRMECERLEHERIAREKAEADMMECESIAREKARRETEVLDMSQQDPQVHDNDMGVTSMVMPPEHMSAELERAEEPNTPPLSNRDKQLSVDGRRALPFPGLHRSKHPTSPPRCRRSSSYRDYPPRRPVSPPDHGGWTSYRDYHSRQQDRAMSPRRGRSRSSSFARHGRSPSPGPRGGYQSPGRQGSRRLHSPHRGSSSQYNRQTTYHREVPRAVPPVPAPSSLAPTASSPLATTSVASFDRMSHSAADTTKTRWLTERLGQFDIPNTVDLRFIKHPDYSSLHVVCRGRLVVSKRTEVRLRLWRAQYPDVPLWYLGVRCLSRGLDWQASVSVPRPAAPVPRPAHLGARCPPLFWKGDTFQEYDVRVRAMLRLPFARRFLTMGGIAWRIALHYGPESLFAAALSGPSTDAYVHGRVDRIGRDIDDTVTADDIALLLGTATGGGSLWPPVDIFEKYEKWQGEWSHEWEAWFQKRLLGIQCHDRSFFLSRQRWIKHRRRYTVNEYNDPAQVGSDGHAAELCTLADQLYPPMESYAALV